MFKLIEDWTWPRVYKYDLRDYYLFNLVFLPYIIRAYISLLIGNKASGFIVNICLRKYFIFMHNAVSKQSTAASRQRKKERISAESLVAVNWTGNLNCGIPTPKSSSFLRFLSSSVVCSHTFDYIATVMGTARAIKLKQSLNGLVNDILAFSARLIKFMSRRKFYPETMNVLELRGTFLVSPRCCHVV